MKKNSLIRNALILLAITLIAGILLSFVYEITKDPIKNAEEDAKKAAYRIVLNADEYIPFQPTETFLDQINQEFANGKYDEQDISYKRVCVDEILLAKKDGNEVGFVFTVTSKDGYGGNIQVTYGLNAQKTITGFTVLSQNETAGFGAKCADEKYQKEFMGINSAQDDKILITGATYTSTAIKETVGAGFATLKLIEIKEGK